MFQHCVMQSHSHLQCYTQAQFSQAAVHTQQHISPPTQTQSPIGNIHTQRHTLVGVATHTDRYSGPLRHTLKLMDTFDCTETRSLSPHPGKQSYTHTFTPIHTQSHTHTRTYYHQQQRHNPSHIPTLPTRSQQQLRGQEGVGPRSCCCRP